MAALNSENRARVFRSLLLRDGGWCHWCGASIGEDNATIDHLLPRARGGRNTLENLVLACGPCNQWRGNTVGLPYVAPPKSGPGRGVVVRFTRSQANHSHRYSKKPEWLVPVPADDPEKKADEE